MENQNVTQTDELAVDVPDANDGSVETAVVEVVRAARVITPEIINQAQIKCGMTQDEIDTKINAVFDRLEGV